MPDKLLKVLIVDDDRLGRKLLTRSLEGAGFEVIECRDGVEALQILEEAGPALLVLDYQMPEFNGAQVCELIRTSKDPEIQQIPIILLTALSGEDHEVECLQAGADDFVLKPVNLAVLRARIDTHLRLHALRTQLQEQNHELELWRQSHEFDLEKARTTQQALLPKTKPEISGWEFAMVYQPLIQVGGDMYDFRHLPSGATLIWVADATGHGASAALLTTLAKLLFRHGVAEHADLEGIAQSVNRDLFGVFKGRSFMSIGCVIVSPDSDSISWCGAGHPPLLVIRRSGKLEFIESAAPPVGLQREIEIIPSVAHLEPGDGFLIYTDGLYGANGGSDNRLIQERLAEVARGPMEEPQVFLERALERARAQSRNGEFADDVTAVSARRMKAV